MIMFNHAQLLSAIENIDGSIYLDGLEYEHFLKHQAKYLSEYTNILRGRFYVIKKQNL